MKLILMNSSKNLNNLGEFLICYFYKEKVKQIVLTINYV